MSVPVSHLEESQKLTADAEVDLFEIRPRNIPTVFRFYDGPTITWQGRVYEGMASRLTGDSQRAEDEESRPTLQVLNPLGIFNESVINGDLDLAVVTRKRLLRANLDNNVNLFVQRMWYVGRPRELISGQSVTFELRNMSEGANFQIPVRMYVPPEFPTVQL